MANLVPLQCNAVSASPVIVPPLSEMVVTAAVEPGGSASLVSQDYVSLFEPPQTDTTGLAGLLDS